MSKVFAAAVLVGAVSLAPSRSRRSKPLGHDGQYAPGLRTQQTHGRADAGVRQPRPRRHDARSMASDQEVGEARRVLSRRSAIATNPPASANA